MTEQKIVCPKCKKETKINIFTKRYGICIMCQVDVEKEERLKFDSDHAIREGEGSSDVNAICPYCGAYQADSWEFSDDDEITCCDCEKEFILHKDHNTTYQTSKKEVTNEKN